MVCCLVTFVERVLEPSLRFFMGHLLAKLSIFYWSIGLISSAQHPYYYVLNHSQGLPSNEVYVLEQDDFGYLWIGCDAGLYRYNGCEFEELKQPERKGSISNVQIFNGETVWCQNFRGQIFRGHIFSDSLSVFFDAAPYCSRFPDFLSLTHDRILVLADTMLLEIDSSGILRSMGRRHFPNMEGNFSSIERIDGGGVMVCDYRGNTALVNKEGVQFMDSPEFMGEAENFRLFSNTMGCFLLGIIQGKRAIKHVLYRWEGTTFIPWVSPFFFEGHRVFSLGAKGRELFLNTSNGVYSCAPGGFLHKEKPWLEGKEISWYYRDREGMSYYAGLKEGIFVVPDTDLQELEMKGPDGLPLENISCIGKDLQGGLWFGGIAGSVYANYSPGRNEAERRFIKNGEGEVRKLLFYNEFLLVARETIQRVHLPTGKVEVLAHVHHVRDFLMHKDTLFYIGPDRQGYLTKLGKNKVLRAKGGLSLCFFQGRMYSLFTDGLFVWQRGQWEEVRFEGGSIFGQSMVATQEELYLATLGKGLLVYDGEVWDQCLPGLNKKSQELLHMATFGKGVFVADRKSVYLLGKGKEGWQTLRQFNIEQLSEVLDLEVWNGFLYLATVGKLYRVDLMGETQNLNPPKVRFKNVESKLKSHDSEALVELKHSDRSLRLYPDAAIHRSRGGFSYAYRLYGWEEEWHIVPGSQSEISFNELPYGKFEVQLKAINEGGVEGPIASLVLHVRQPFWTQWWFWGAVVFLLVGLFFLVFRYRLRRVQDRIQQKQSALTAELTALKAQLNPHFMFNTLNSLQDLILKRDIEQSNYYLAKFASLMRQVLQHSGQETVPLSFELSYLKDYLELEELRFGKEFQFVWFVDPMLEREDPDIPPLLVQPYLENAIKHGLLHAQGKKRLEIHFMDEGAEFQCIIRDNGIGREQSAQIRQRQHASFSGHANEKRIELLKSLYKKGFSLEIIDLMDKGMARGTEVRIRVSKRLVTEKNSYKNRRDEAKEV